MFKLIFGLLILCVIHRSSQYSIADATLKRLERAIEETDHTLDELLASASFSDENNDNYEVSNEISPLASQIYNRAEPAGLFHREPDFDFNVQQMIEYRGFKYEAHHVVTEDCYVLEMHRIVNPNDNTPNKPPVLLQHGLIDSSSGWLVNTVEGRIDDEDDRNLGFALAKRGYDVWMGNYRGNTYSKNHTTFSTRDHEFWKFTYDNHAFQGEQIIEVL